MDREFKIALGRLLGAVYRGQLPAEKKKPHQHFDEGTIFGLLNGIEEVIDAELLERGLVTREQVSAAAEILDEYHESDSKLASLRGYYELEKAFEGRGMDRAQANTVMKYFKAHGRFDRVMKMLDTRMSPGEMRTFDLGPQDV